MAKDPRRNAAEFAAHSLRTRSDQLFGLAYDNYNYLDYAVAFRDMAEEFEAWAWLTTPPNKPTTSS